MINEPAVDILIDKLGHDGTVYVSDGASGHHQE